MKLTKTQKSILKELCETGETNKVIASRLYVAEKTVKNHINAIFKALDVDTRSKAIVKAIKSGIVVILFAITVRADDAPPPCENIIFKYAKPTTFLQGYAFGREDERAQISGIVRDYYVKLSTANPQGRKAVSEVYKLIDTSTWIVNKTTAPVN